MPSADRLRRREPFQVRKATLAPVLSKAASGPLINEHVEAGRHQ
jgi:hypothetical protein